MNKYLGKPSPSACRSRRRGRRAGLSLVEVGPALAGNRQGFSLIELIVVCALIGILATLTIPVLTTAMRGTQLTRGAQMLSEQLSLARQAALSSNHAVEVRFYQFSDSDVPGEQANMPNTGKYRAMQAFEIKDSGVAAVVGKLQRIPPSVIIDSGAALSSLLGISQQKTWTPSDPQVNVPGVGNSYNCRVFSYLPDGSTNLSPPTSQWFLTMHGITDGDLLSAAPANFFSILVDASNGHIQTFRP